MTISSKELTMLDYEQTLRYAYSDETKTIAVGSFIGLKVGHKIVRTLPSANIEEYAFYDGANLLQTLRLTYTDATLNTISEVERVD